MTCFDRSLIRLASAAAACIVLSGVEEVSEDIDIKLREIKREVMILMCKRCAGGSEDGDTGC